jgi:hypothetical protein
LQHEKHGAQVDRQHPIPFLLGELEQWPDFGDACIIEQHIKAPPALVCRIEHALDVRCTGHVRLHRSLPKLISEGLGAVGTDVRQQQLRALARHASRAGGADTARSARDERVNTREPIGHRTMNCKALTWPGSIGLSTAPPPSAQSLKAPRL